MDVSGTSRCRNRLAPFCKGCGVDLGAGGDPIVPTAICVDPPVSYSRVGDGLTHLTGDAANLRWFADGSLDYVYSSHLLEDFWDTEAVLKEWVRVLRRRGRLVLYCPDEYEYRKYCLRTGEGYNIHHKHPDFRCEGVRQMMPSLGMNIIHEIPLIDDYSWDLVAEKV